MPCALDKISRTPLKFERTADHTDLLFRREASLEQLVAQLTGRRSSADTRYQEKWVSEGPSRAIRKESPNAKKDPSREHAGKVCDCCRAERRTVLKMRRLQYPTHNHGWNTK